MKKREYDSGRFSDLSETPLGKKLWSFLNERETVIRMTTASDLGKPAVAGLGSRTLLVKLFGEEVTGDRWKQLIGHMVRQVMEAEPFGLDAQGLKVGDDSMFSKGSRYRRRVPHWGHLYVEGKRGGAGLLYGDLGADDVEHALELIKGFLERCLSDESPEARIEVRERGATPSRKASSAPVTLKVHESELESAMRRFRRALGVGPLAPNVDFAIRFSY
jgi:hypothetical protein